MVRLGPKMGGGWGQNNQITVISSYELTKALKLLQMFYNLEIYFEQESIRF